MGSEWKKSSFSNGSGGSNCVEIRPMRGLNDALIGVEVRNSAVPEGHVLRFTPAEWEAFVKGVEAGEFA